MRLRQLPIALAGAIVLLGVLALVVLFEEGAHAGMPKFSDRDSRPHNIAITAAAKKRPSRLHTGKPGIEMMVHFEGRFPRPYNDPVGHCTVGIGHLIHYGPCTAADYRGVWVRGQKTPGVLTTGEQNRLLRSRLAKVYEPAVRALFRPGGPLRGLFNQYRFDSFVSFVLNLGPGAVRCVSGFASMCAAIHSRNIRQIADAMLGYTRASGRVLPGLVRRRQSERMMMLARPAPFEAFTRAERHAIRLYDRLRKARRKPARRAELARYMGRRAKRIRKAARAEVDGWMTNRRRVRHDALERRARPVAKTRRSR